MEIAISRSQFLNISRLDTGHTVFFNRFGCYYSRIEIAGNLNLEFFSWCIQNSFSQFKFHLFHLTMVQILVNENQFGIL